MASIFNNPPLFAINRQSGASQRLQDGPEELFGQRALRYDGPPPPYPASGETTQPPTPEPFPEPPLDNYGRRLRRREARFAATPINQFRAQVRCETARLEHQRSNMWNGRRDTLPYDDSLAFEAAVENNVRSRWVEQGIWGDNWGPAWPKGSSPQTNWRSHKDGGPFAGPYKPSKANGYAGYSWAHEEPEEEPQPQPSPRPKKMERPAGYGLFGLPRPPTPPQQPQPRPASRYLTAERDLSKAHPVVIPTAPHPEASRPYHQFQYQLAKESEWVRDEWIFNNPGVRLFDLGDRAYQSLKENWIKNQIWNPKWESRPGMKWIYEEPDEEEGSEATRPSSAVEPDWQGSNTPQSPVPDHARISVGNHTGDVEINSGDGSTEDHGQAKAVKRGRGRPRKTPNLQAPAPPNGQYGQGDEPRRSSRRGRTTPKIQQDTAAPVTSSKRKHSSSDTVDDEEAPREPKRAKRARGPSLDISASSQRHRRSTRLRSGFNGAQTPRVAKTLPSEDLASTKSKKGRGRPKLQNMSPAPKKRGRPRKK